MEELNKNQIILLVLLVSFVTSIATGIVTVTLMDQAPAAVTQTINRIVERTVEKVVPRETQISTVIKEVPVIVTEEELIVKAINQGAKALVRLTDAEKEELTFGSGFIVTGGRVVTASQIFTVGATTSIPAKIKAILADGRKIVLENSAAGKPNEPAPAIIIFKLASEKIDDLTTLELVDSAAVIGQTVVALGAANRSGINVAVGIISSFLSTGTTTAPAIMTNAASAENGGGPLLNIKGQVVGLNYGAGLAAPAAAIRAAF